MNSFERIQNVLKRRKTDVLPVAPYMGNHGAAVSGTKLIDYYTKPQAMADAQYTAWKIYNQDMVCMQSDNYYIAEGFGTKTEFYENSTPTFKEPAISDLKEVQKLKIPDPYRDGRMHVYIEATNKIAEKLKGKVAIRSAGTGPFALAAHLMGAEPFLMAIAEVEHGLEEHLEEDLHHLLDLSTEALISFSIAQLEAGADIVQCGDSLASLDMISPTIYEKYAFPYEKKFFRTISPISRKYGAFTLLHICGNNTKVMELQAETGADIIEIDYKADLGFWKESIGDKVVLMGNLNPTGVLLQGTVRTVRDSCQRCIELAAGGGGFILGSGCEVPIYTPKENMMEMVNIARGYKY